MSTDMECDVCGILAPSDDHPCAWGVQCACWTGVGCDGSGESPWIDVNAYSVSTWSQAFRDEAIAAVLESRR